MNPLNSGWYEEKLNCFGSLNNIFQTNLIQLDMLWLWSNSNGCLVLINCGMSASHSTFSALATLKTCQSVSASIRPSLSLLHSQSKVTWKTNIVLEKHVPLWLRTNRDKQINNATAQRAVQIRENEKQCTRCLQVRLLLRGSFARKRPATREKPQSLKG